ncbi:UbiA family prenyltransferase [Oharaeibacter diazotrophicus]|uniref:4-hydroxybenzoate polyprenyltransferase n=1 Tax=Oharaeibacter diazotrophicus TaxID=1920512 RepID=A0A4R6RJV8_9HYPH|nr:UbiA family prenyltransferase [Oharaeibacter diazotrophicus]TDP86823.1 4-hydroxybenzoate polyprenyltransferase [Oharaeibacter diazotrophicus]BBE71234.1 decaprenyl-phosphate phosphoribosyltransferase [Pleomorphomonas sp. SM30]GLS77988.1 hypothetical protein GCM10007904_33250 [Oharaeibacter diazotrophicus]
MDRSATQEAENASTRVPLVIDLDGALLATDSFDETLLDAFRASPVAAVRALAAAWCGRAAGRTRLASLSQCDVRHWPVNAAFLGFVEEQARAGRRIVLTTTADRSVAEAIAARFPFVHRIDAPDGGADPKGQTKAERLSKLFPDGFVYAGRSRDDLAVWAASRGAVVVDATPDVREEVARTCDVLAVFPRKPVRFHVLRRALRLHQWAKNALVFVPLALSGKAGDPAAWMAAALGFLALGFCASASYLINDLWDLPHDRRHWSKRGRPLASGGLPIRAGAAMALWGLVVGLGIAVAAGPAAATVLVLYLAGTLAYSFYLKRVPILDVFVLAGLFTVRIGFGNVLTGVQPSPWLMVFSMFLFLSLSMAKRHTEVLRLADHGIEAAGGRGYVADDAPLTLGIGLAAMLGAVLIFVMYLVEDAFPQGFYARPELLWAMPAILFLFLGRVWLVAQRGNMRDDPVAFALKDRVSLALGTAMGLVVAAAVIPV